MNTPMATHVHLLFSFGHGVYTGITRPCFGNADPHLGIGRASEGIAVFKAGINYPGRYNRFSECGIKNPGPRNAIRDLGIAV
jgi:hypothetical protein